MTKFLEELFSATMILIKETIGFISYCWNSEEIKAGKIISGNHANYRRKDE